MKKVLFIFLLITVWTTIISAQIIEKDKPVPPRTDEIFSLVEEMPRFPGCEDKESKREKKECSIEKLYQYVYDNLEYPELALKDSIEGKVTVRFEVKKDGSISNIKILRDIGYGCGDAAKKVIESMNQNDIKWIPGKQGGREVNVWYTMQVFFKLANAQKQRKKEFNEEEYEMPRFPGCEDIETKIEKEICSTKKLYEYVYSKLKFPALAIRNGVNGMVILKFAVKEDGSVSKVQVLRDIGYGCGKAAKKVIESMNKNHIKWIPGKQGGKKVTVWYTLPVVFKTVAKKRW